MSFKVIQLNRHCLTEDTIDDLHRHNIARGDDRPYDMIGLVIQTSPEIIVITIDKDLITEESLTDDISIRHLGIPNDLRLCLFYLLDHDCDQLQFVNHGAKDTPLLPIYMGNKNRNGANFIDFVKYGGGVIQMKNWPAELLPE